MLWSYLLAFVIALLIHECGHLFAAFACRVPVKEFGLGWGPLVFSFKKGDIEYRLHALPIGAYVRMDIKTLQLKPLGQQVFILIAGILVNLAAAVLVPNTPFSVVNYLLAATNLLPLYHQDGWMCGMVFLRAIMKRKAALVEWVFTIVGGGLSLLVIVAKLAMA
jgi:membrane-associated protease RseP (regulator of RpoE activity)